MINMIYEKGKFTIVPTGYIGGIDPLAQVVFFWICSFANDDGQCFPSIKTLMKLSQIKSNKTVNEKIKILENVGLLSHVTGSIKGGKTTSNRYQIMIPTSVIDTPHSVTDTQGVVQEIHTNYTNNNYTNTNVLESDILPFNLDSETTKETGKSTDAIAKKVDQRDVNKVLAVWNKYNPAVGYVNKGQRNAVEAMLGACTLDEAIDYVNQAISVQGEQFAPSITSPYELRSKNIKLQQFLERRNL